MAIKDTLILGVAGAAGIIIARKLPMVETVMDQSAPYNGKMLPILPANFGGKNGWSALFWILPAAGAWYLSN